MADPKPYLRAAGVLPAQARPVPRGPGPHALPLLPSQGSYFQCVDISTPSATCRREFCKWLTREIGVAAIPLSAFYGKGFDQRVVRFCFAKKDETLNTRWSGWRSSSPALRAPREAEHRSSSLQQTPQEQPCPSRSFC
jgi:methionine aminotransferase